MGLLITALNDDAGHKFTSARMNTMSSFRWCNGRVEAVIKAPPHGPAGEWPGVFG